ncbi:hypothetical protein C0992_007254 [Termitomyces sp. T32_za158]|nr:hypothetical protein C0992_007254 [Termitomyces sp. T32_za158]
MPNLTPIWLKSEIWATHGVMTDINAPEKNPYTAANTISPTRFFVNIQKTREENPEKNAEGMRRLKRPRESERATRQEPIARRTYLVSEKVFHDMQRSVRFEGERLLTHSVATMQHTALTRPEMRTPHPNPTDTKRRCSMIGYTTPPNMV